MDDRVKIASLKVYGICLIVFAALYLIIGSLALAGKVQGLLPGHENMETLLVVLAYASALLMIIAGIACIKNASCAHIFGIILVVVNGISLIYTIFAHQTINYFDAFMIGLSMGIYYWSKK